MKNEKQSFIQPLSTRTLDVHAIPLVIRACTSTYVVFGIMWGILIPLCLYNAIYLLPHDWQPVELLSGILIGFFIMIRMFKVVVTADSISYRTLFSGTRKLAFSNIQKACVRVGVDEDDKFAPFIRLELTPISSINSQPMRINLKVFSLDDVHQLLTILPSLGVEISGRHKIPRKKPKSM